MFAKMIRNDLKKKKSMNFILFIFIVFTSLLFASSGNVFYTAANALDSYFKKANVNDYFVFAMKSDAQDNQIKEWADNCKEVKMSEKSNYLYLEDSQITLPSGNKLDDPSFTILGTVPDEKSLVFDDKTHERFSLKKGEIAITKETMENGKLKIGSKVTVDIQGHNYTYTVKNVTKDAVVGASICACRRLFVSQEDYDSMLRENKDVLQVTYWSFEKNANANLSNLASSFESQGYNTVVNFSINMIKTAYFLDLIMIGIMVIISLFLLVIAFLILRFTIVFTLQENFHEIGVMKAIGLSNRKIRNMYLAKYLFLAVFGGCIGFLASIFASRGLMGIVVGNIIIEESPAACIVGLVATILEIALIALFCNLCTRRVRKFSAVAAIRGGDTGESYSKRGRIRLYRRGRMRVPEFLAVNDVLSHFRRYIVLFVTFVLGTILLIFPTNIMDTLNSDKMLELSGETKYDFTMDMLDLLRYEDKGTKQELMDHLSKLEDEANVQGIKIKLRPETFYSAKLYADDRDKAVTVQTKMTYNYDCGDDISFVEGSKPKYANEMAISKMAADRLKVGVGDTVHCRANNKEDSFVVTGLYPSINNLGMAAIWSKEYNLNPNNFAGISLMGDFTEKLTDEQKKASIEKLKGIFTNSKILDREERLEKGLGDYTSQLTPMKSSVLFIVLAINLLITILTTRMLLSRETGEIAILKSMGMKSRTICRQQVLRIVIVLLFGVIVGGALSGFVGNALAGQIFNMVGVSKISLSVNPWQVYGLYPLYMLLVIVTGVVLSTASIWKVKVWESAE